MQFNDPPELFVMFLRTPTKVPRGYYSIRVTIYALGSLQTKEGGSWNSEPVERQDGVGRLRKRSMAEMKAEEPGYKKRILYSQWSIDWRLLSIYNRLFTTFINRLKGGKILVPHNNPCLFEGRDKVSVKG